jgi:hypothetical protein
MNNIKNIWNAKLEVIDFGDRYWLMGITVFGIKGIELLQMAYIDYIFLQFNLLKCAPIS